MNVLSLFSGIGGLDLAAEWAGMHTVAFVERDENCQKVLSKNWPGIKIHDDVCTLTARDVPERIDIITGGYPCQPFSTVGKRQGADDERHLWPEYLRLIEEFEPYWVVGENVAGHVTLGLDQVIDDLEYRGYATRAILIPAASIGAQSIRERVFILAYNAEKRRTKAGMVAELQEEFRGKHRETSGLCDTKIPAKTYVPIRQRFWEIDDAEPCGGVHGLPSELDKDRFGMLGNTVIPQQAYPIFKSIMDIESIA